MCSTMKILVLFLLVGISLGDFDDFDYDNKNKDSDYDYKDLHDYDSVPIKTTRRSKSRSSTTKTPKEYPNLTTPKPKYVQLTEPPRQVQKKPLIEAYITRNQRLAQDFVRDLKRTKYEVAANVLTKANKQIDNILSDISQLLGRKCKHYWRVDSEMESESESLCSAEEIQHKIMDFEDNILVNTRYRTESDSMRIKIEEELGKLHKNYASALRTANMFSVSEENLIRPSEDGIIYLSDSPPNLLINTESSETTAPTVEKEEERDEITVSQKFDFIESKPTSEKIDILIELIEKLKSGGMGQSSKLLQLGLAIQNSRDKGLQVLKNKFPVVAQKIIFDSKSRIKIEIGNITYKLTFPQNETVLALPYDDTNDRSADGGEWSFLPVGEQTFALYNIDRKTALGSTLKNHSHPANGSRREGLVFGEPIAHEHITMFYPELLWKIMLVCQRKIIGVEDYKENLIQFNSTSAGEPGDTDINGQDEMKDCPDDSMFVTFISWEYPDLSLDLDINGKVFLGEGKNPGRFEIY